MTIKTRCISDLNPPFPLCIYLRYLGSIITPTLQLEYCDRFLKSCSRSQSPDSLTKRSSVSLPLVSEVHLRESWKKPSKPLILEGLRGFSCLLVRAYIDLVGKKICWYFEKYMPYRTHKKSSKTNIFLGMGKRIVQ